MIDLITMKQWISVKEFLPTSGYIVEVDRDIINKTKYRAYYDDKTKSWYKLTGFDNHRWKLSKVIKWREIENDPILKQIREKRKIVR